MAHKQSKSQRIRTMLDQNKSVKEICKAVKCSPALVYQVKSYDKNKAKKVSYQKLHNKVVARLSEEAAVLNKTKAKTPVKAGSWVEVQPKDYYQPKPSLFQRVKNFFFGA